MQRQRLLRLFGDRRGNVGLIFALSLVPIMALVGGGLDLRRAATSRSYVQDASDAAVLAAAKNYFNNYSLAAGPRLAAAQAAADATMTAELAQRKKIVLNMTDVLALNATTGALQLTVNAQSPTVFGAMLGITTIPYKVEAFSAAGGKPVEIALMLDNTASMFQIGTGGTTARFTTMRQAAESYVNQVFDLGGNNVKVAVVPWATLVNINAEQVAAVDPSPYSVPTVAPMGSGRTPLASAVDHTGVLADPTNPATALTAAKLASYAAPTTWRGCVRSATGEVTVDANGNVTKPITDAAPAGKWPAALLASSMSLSYTAAKAATTKTTTTTVCDQTGPGTTTTTTTVCDQYTTVTTPDPPGPQGALHRHQFGAPGLALAADRRMKTGRSIDDIALTPQQQEWKRLLHRAATTTTCTKSHTVTTTKNTTVCIASHTVTTTTPVAAKPESCAKNEAYSEPGPVPGAAAFNAYLGSISPCTTTSSPPPICQSDPNEISYINAGKVMCAWRPDAFSGNARNYTAESQAISGPNMNCPVPILPLSSNRAQVLNKLNEMYPVPTGTLTDVGILWGLRALSPNSYWTSFWGLNASQAPAAFNDGKTYKIAILLSDGVNEAPFWMEGYYGCTGAKGATSTPSAGTSGRYNAGDCWRSPNITAMPRTQTADNTAANNMMLSACSQMRTVYGVDLYYILVDVTDPNALALAQQCAPGAGHAISTSSGNLQSVFNSLVSRTLRLTH